MQINSAKEDEADLYRLTLLRLREIATVASARKGKQIRLLVKRDGEVRLVQTFFNNQVTDDKVS